MNPFGISKQEMFDIALNGVRSQGYQSASRFGDCMYDDGNGGKCAAGHILAVTYPDADLGLYENENISSVIRKMGLFNGSASKALMNTYITFATDLQSIHDAWGERIERDEVDFLPYFEELMSELAKRNNLSYEV